MLLRKTLLVFTTLAVLFGVVVVPGALAATFGNTEAGPKEDKTVGAEVKRANSYELKEEGEVTKLSVYAVHGSHWASGKKQKLKAMIYSDSSGSPTELLATGSEVIYEGTEGWFALPFASPVKLKPGTYWIGFISGGENEVMGFKWKEVTNSRRKNHNDWSEGPSNPFSKSGEVKTDNEEMSLYATYEPTHLGTVKYRVDAASEWDSIIEKATEEQTKKEEAWKKWIQENLATIKAYPPFGNKYVELKTGLPVEAYRDWPNEGSPRYAPLTEEKRNKFLSEKVESDVKAGYSGEFLDDVNWSLGFRDWEQSKTEIEPEQEEEADLVAGVREKIGQKARFEMNSQFKDIYPLMKEGNANVAEALENVDIVTKEFGVGYLSGLEKASQFKEFTEYVEKLHAKGIQIAMTGAGECAITREEFEYQLATYFLVNANATNQHAERPKAEGDYINGTKQVPTKPEKSASTIEPEAGKWWKGWEVNLGAPTTAPPKEANANGVWTREFTKGIVYVLQPEAAEQTIKLPAGKTWKNIKGETITEVTLKPRKVKHGEKCEGAETTMASGAVVIGS